MAARVLQHGGEVLGAGFRGWRPDVPRDLADSIDLMRWDIRKPAPMEVAQRVQDFEPTVVFHFAAISIPSMCGTDCPTPQAIAVNVDGTSHILDLTEAVAAQQAASPRFVFASTCHVYDRVTRSNAVVSEDATLAPVSAYGETKLQCEQEILRRTEAGKVSATIARGFHHIGPRQPSGLMLTDWLEQLGDPQLTQVKVRSTNSFLDLVDVRDAAEAYVMLSEVGKVAQTYNLGSGRVSNSGEVLRDILAMVDRPIEVVSNSDEERWNTIADVTKLQSLGWDASITYQETVRDMFRLLKP